MLKLVEPDVVGVLLGVLGLGHVAHGLHDAVQVGLEARPVVGRLGAAPDVVCLGGEAGEGGLLLGGDVDEGGAVSADDAGLGQARLPHELRALLYAVQKRSDLGRAERLDALLLEQGHGLAALGGRLCRVDDGAKGGYLVDGVAVAVERALQGVQLGDVGARVGDCRLACGRGVGVGHGSSSGWVSSHESTLAPPAVTRQRPACLTPLALCRPIMSAGVPFGT